ncbi:MAG: RdgB/HAM1 family non-canonical purine NTP pyrophosphatase [Bacteroidetes bacterium]|nr:RdgB/HAM1 family non-canonical purine NTP pyrophosphatase [Bacteroidota bacterium]
MKLIFASHNQNKTREINQILGNFIQVYSLTDLGIHEEIPETGSTLPENALLKAQAAADITGLSVFADDTGLEVEALNGAPGVISARYAGPGKSALANMEKLLDELQGKSNRNARFVTCICLIINNEKHLFEGELKGRIGYEMRGEKGFGYDPLFIPEGDERTLAELSADEKNSISHRAKAIEKMRLFLETKLGSTQS